MSSEPISPRIVPRESSHCQLARGELFHNYKIIKALGKGRFAKVWSASAEGGEVAIKIYRCGTDNVRYYANEVKILSLLMERCTEDPPHVTKYLNTFAHVSINNNYKPNIHPCITFKCAGARLVDLIKG